MLQLAYHAPGFMRLHALELIWMIGSSATILSELEAIVLDETSPISERRHALWAMAATPGDFYFPRLARFVTLKPDPDGLKLSFYDLARLAQHHPSNHEWLFRKFEAKGAEVYLEALEIATRFNDNKPLNPLLIQRLITHLNQHPSVLDVALFARLAHHAGDIGRSWLIDHLEQAIELYNKEEQTDTFFYALKKLHVLDGAIIEKQPSFAQILTEHAKEQNERERLEKIKAANAPYLQSPSWKKMYGLYERAKQDQSAAWCLRDIAMNQYRMYPTAVRLTAIFFLRYLQHQYPALLWFLCSLVKQYDGCEREYYAPIRQEALIALGYSPTAEVWEALIEGYFYNRTNYLDWIYPQTIRYVTDALEMGSKFVPITPIEPFSYHQLNSGWFHKLTDIDFEIPDQCR